ncbi:PIG-L deacetylase family protein [Lichenihabitans psoromatis]|uniref:PIG-L deacetylase family protein n=1 Tax=Lichenihabitans psoromatis TaxID=2528642 RepID=UPI00103848C1|nr:PIG-L family deacetylase [Lichenihabitans psoromatis]
MTRTALALSPHLDDAAFSCGGTLATLVRDGWSVRVATLFTRSVPNPHGFALACQLDKGLGPDVDYMALRRAEDLAAMRALGVAEPIHVELPEAPHRGYTSANALFQPPLATDTIGIDLRAAIERLMVDHAPDLIFAPQAIGGHVDHVQLVKALDGLEKPVLWWRDFPYVARTANPAEPFAHRMHVMPEHSLRLNADAAAAKEASCLAYATQLCFQFGGPDGLRTKLSECSSAEGFRGQGLPWSLMRDMSGIGRIAAPARS